ncbi:MAG: hypothetical protein CMJ62_08450, partial [Planctomycetaceae bacterium]|nr:hypothetical protein [Planctomycetaceae bacterium]
SDYNTLAGSFNPIGYGGATAVPEPASLVLFVLGLILHAAGTGYRRN